MEAEIMKAPI